MRPGPDRLLLPSGLALVLLVAVVAASRQRFDAEEVCRRVGECVTPATAGVLGVLLGVQAVGVLAVLAGLVSRVRAQPVGAAVRPSPRRVLAVAFAGAGWLLVAAVPMYLAGALGPHPLVAAVLVFLLVQAELTAGLLDAGVRTRATALAGPIAAATATLVPIGLVYAVPGLPAARRSSRPVPCSCCTAPSSPASGCSWRPGRATPPPRWPSPRPSP